MSQIRTNLNPAHLLHETLAFPFFCCIVRALKSEVFASPLDYSGCIAPEDSVFLWDRRWASTSYSLCRALLPLYRAS